MQKKERWLEQLASIWDKATEEERAYLQTIPDRIQSYQEGKHSIIIDAYLQPERRWLNEDTFEVKIPLHKGTENLLNMTHGGITATLIDISMGSLVKSLLPEDKAPVTLEIKINYIKPGNGSFLRCETRIISQSKRFYTIEGTVYDDKNDIVAHGTGTFYVIRIS